MNFILSNDKVQELINNKIINPFVPKGENGMTPIYVLDKKHIKLLEGEGGLGSGKPLKLTEEQRKERRREQLKNAQRKYRNADRASYNARQLLYYNAMKENTERYQNWKTHMAEANKRYREKKSLGKPPKKLVKDIETQLKKEWKEQNKGKAGRPKKGEIKKDKKEIDKAWFEAEKHKRIQEEMKKIGKDYVIPMKNTGMISEETGKPIYEKYNFVLKNKPDYPYTGDVSKGGDMPYTEEDYIAYNTTSLVPKKVKKEYKKLVGDEYVDKEEKKEKKEKEKVEKQKPKKEEKEMTQDEMEYELVRQYTEEVEPLSQADIKKKNVRQLIMSSSKFLNWLNKD